jgi:cytochrome c oxidase cbb3-type subunit 1
VAARSARELDRSCRVPVALLLGLSAMWLVWTLTLVLITSIQLHTPSFLAECPWLTYGRLRPVMNVSFLYGFASPAALGIGLWVLCRLGGARFVAAPCATLGALLWHAGLKIGVLAILAGHNSGFESLELPRASALILLIGFTAIGIPVLLTFHARTNAMLYPSQWFILAACFWFPWLCSTAVLLLRAAPVRGAAQWTVSQWYASGVSQLWLGSLALAAILYCLPKWAGRALHSRGLALYAFWTLALLGAWGRMLPGDPVPRWLPALSTLATILLVLPAIAVAINAHRTLAGAYSKIWGNPALRLVLLGCAGYVASAVLSALLIWQPMAAIARFSFLDDARLQLLHYGYLTLVFVGAGSYAFGRVVREPCIAPALAKLFSWGLTLGTAISVGALAIAGVSHGIAQLNPQTELGEAARSLALLLALNSAGVAVLLAGAAGWLLHLVGALWSVARRDAAPALHRLNQPTSDALATS